MLLKKVSSLLKTQYKIPAHINLKLIAQKICKITEEALGVKVEKHNGDIFLVQVVVFLIKSSRLLRNDVVSEEAQCLQKFLKERE